MKYYLMLSKSRLTALVATTSAAGYSMAPNVVFDPITLVRKIGLISLYSPTFAYQMLQLLIEQFTT